MFFPGGFERWDGGRERERERGGEFKLERETEERCGPWREKMEREEEGKSVF